MRRQQQRRIFEMQGKLSARDSLVLDKSRRNVAFHASMHCFFCGGKLKSQWLHVDFPSKELKNEARFFFNLNILTCLPHFLPTASVTDETALAPSCERCPPRPKPKAVEDEAEAE